MRLPSRSLKYTSIIDAFESLVPLKLADSSWDNVGLLLECWDHESDKDVTDVLVTVDLTEPVALEAASKGFQMVLAYHPTWFRPMKCLTSRSAPVLSFLAGKQISVWSPHTALDNMVGGMNDWVGQSLFPQSRASLVPMINNEEEPLAGAGRLIKFPKDGEQLTVVDVIRKVQSLLEVTHLRYSLAIGKSLDDPVDSVGICVGSGSSVLFNKTTSNNPAVFLTGEMSHHDMLRAASEFGTTVILTEHSTMERAFLKGAFMDGLAKALPSVRFHYSVLDHDPVHFL